MSTNALRPSVVRNAPEGIVRVFVPSGLELSKLELRQVAQKAAGTIDVGRTPAGKSSKLDGVAGHSFDFAPVVRSGGPSAEAPAEDPRIAVLTSLGLSPEQVAAVLAAQPQAPVKAPKAKAETTKAPREVPAFLRKWENVTCKTCRDFGKVRGPGAGDKAGRPFRTQHGADSAPTAVACPAHISAGRKSA